MQNSVFLVQWCYFVVCYMKESGQNGKRRKQKRKGNPGAKDATEGKGTENPLTGERRSILPITPF